MSTPASSNEGGNESTQGLKKRRLAGSCDLCKRKKIRCDSAEMPGNKCTNCIACGFECTHNQVSKKLGPVKEYVENLEQRLEKMERLLLKLSPGMDVDQAIDGDLGQDSPAESSNLPRNDGYDSLAARLSQLKLSRPHQRFFGQSSNVAFIITAMDLKNQYTGEERYSDPPFFGKKRQEFWNVRPWQQVTFERERPYYVFPDDDLVATLVDLYFAQINTFLPLLHRPTFMKSIAEGLQFCDPMFGSTLLLVCALGSRYSNDPRVFLEGTDTPHSCGWKWFSQVQVIQRSLEPRPSLYEVQCYPLAVLYIHGLSAPQGVRLLTAHGIHLVQEVGAHRCKLRQGPPSVESELWKRAFWVLMSLDRFTSASLGQSLIIQDADFDLDLPIECDDEYWEHPEVEMAFKQPPDKPSTITFFNCYLTLLDIQASAMRTIYSMKKPKTLPGDIEHFSDQHIISELDSALNQWVDSVPDHLRWDPNRENKLFFDQSAFLYATYYHLQIFIHRPFIPSPNKFSSLSFPSLAICTNAARSCIHVIDIQSRRGVLPLPHMQIPAVTAGIVLLLYLWSGKRSGMSPNAMKEMNDIHKCMDMLHVCEQRWHYAGRFWDILSELASAGDLFQLEQNPSPTKKRYRCDDKPTAAPIEHQTPTSIPPQEPHIVADLPCPGDIHPIPNVHERATSDSQFPAFMPLTYNEQLSLPHKYRNNEWYSNVSATYGLPSGHSGGPVSSEVFEVDNLTDFGLGGLSYGQEGGDFPTAQQQPIGVGAGLFPPVLGEPQQHEPELDIQSYLNTKSAPMLGSDILAMWSNAPTGYEWEDWGTYITNVDYLTHGHDDPSGQ